MTLSAIIHTKNAAKTLKKCLESVKFADQIVVIDMNSQDNTKKIASNYTSHIYNYPDVGYADPARNFGLKKASGDWILVVDADEEVPETLKKKILEIVNANQKFDVYELPRANYMFDNWIKHSGWWPDYQPRLFKKGRVSWQVGVHRMPDISGLKVKLPAKKKYALIHHNYQSINHFIDKMQKYTSLQAKERQLNENINGLLLIQHFFDEFYKRLFLFEGYKDNTHGVALSLLQSMYELVILLKQWELNNYKSQRNHEELLYHSLEKLIPSFRYWLADWKIKQTSGWRKLYWMIRRKFKI